MKGRVTLQAGLIAPSTVLLVAQVCFAFGRPIAGLIKTGIHFGAPYPSVNSAASKEDIRWNVDDVLRMLPRCKRVTVEVADEWLARYLVMVRRSSVVEYPGPSGYACIVATDRPTAGQPQCLVVTTERD